MPFALCVEKWKIFFQFEEEVREIITSVFEKHCSGQDVFQKVCHS